MNVRTHFLQSEDWALFQAAKGNETITKRGDGWQYLAVIERSRIASRLYCPYGPSVVDSTSLADALADLRTEAHRRHLSYVRIEPLTPLSQEEQRSFGLKKAQKDIQPRHTIVSDLTGSQDDILAAMAQNSRWLWRKNTRNGMTYEESYDPGDLTDFLAMLRSVSSRTAMTPHKDAYFQQMAASLFPRRSAGLVFAVLDGKRVASILFFKDSTTFYYAHAASYDEYRKISPATSLVVHAMLFARQQGCTAFDFCGSAPPDAPDSHPWHGFTKFKLSFGGQIVTRAGTWELPVSPLRYAVYRQAVRLYKQLKTRK